MKQTKNNQTKPTNRRTKKGALIALGLAGAIAITGAFAFLSDSDSAINRFLFSDKDGEQTVDVDIEEPSWKEEAGKNILPLGTVSKDPQVINEGENDIYSFVTVLVPTAKTINLNNADGTVYSANDVELFVYKVNPEWQEVAKTNASTSLTKGAENRIISVNGKEFTLNASTADSITDKATSNSNVYYTAHTYALAKDAEMTVLSSGETSTPVFNSVTMINIADGESTFKTLQDVYDSLIPDDDTTLEMIDTNADEVQDAIIATKTSTGDTKTIYTMNDGKVLDTNGNIQYKTLAQLKADDNINIYVSAYAIQSDNVAANMNDCWDICANANAGIEEDDNLPSDFYFKAVHDDVGAKSSMAAD